jgi:hypothetical protein
VGQPTAVGAAWERAITFGFGPSEVASWERSDEERTHRYDETERSGGLHVDHQLEFGWKAARMTRATRRPHAQDRLKKSLMNCGIHHEAVSEWGAVDG